jgi:hypothetical protein
MTDDLKALFGAAMPALARLARDAAGVDQATQDIRALLPAELRPHLLTAVRHASDLVLTADSAAWATRLRYAAPQLREALATADAAAAPQRVRIKVRGRKA